MWIDILFSFGLGQNNNKKKTKSSLSVSVIIPHNSQYVACSLVPETCVIASSWIDLSHAMTFN